MRRAVTDRLVFFLTISGLVMATHAMPPHADVGRETYPDADAIVLKWEQHWTLHPDGAVTYNDQKWVKILDSRAIRRYADPRIDVDTANDEVTIDACRTWTANLDVIPVPEYGINVASPGEFNGWPQWAAWQQRIVSFSGIEMGCIVELAYTRTTRAGVFPWLDADLQLNLDDPTVERIVRLTVPTGTEVLHQLDRVQTDGAMPAVSTKRDGFSTYTWTMGNLGAALAELQSFDWRQRCGRLRFTTCSGIVGWTNGVLGAVNAAVEPSSSITNFALDTIGDEQDMQRCVALLVDRLRASFNLVENHRAWRDLQCNSADIVFERNYGNTLEATALLAALCRSIGLPVAIYAVGHGSHFDPAVPTLSSMDGLLVRVGEEAEPIYARPDGTVFVPATVPYAMQLFRQGSEQLDRITLQPRHDQFRNHIHADGRLAIDTDGHLSGDLKLTLGGVFFDPLTLTTAADQTRSLQRVVRALIPGAELQSHTVSELSDGTLVARIEIGAAVAVVQRDDLWTLQLGEHPMFLSTISLDLERSQRMTDIDLRCALHEMIDLTITAPDGWEVVIAPARIETAAGTWGEAIQLVATEASTVQLHREINLRRDRLSPSQYAELRPALNMMRSTAARTLVIRPPVE